ncbi:hypothetical protein [Acetobacter sp.]|jgi:hypothetical protein|uniref:hypothetical protein n=1 Tax=Acetobacter sp. TaxID=440 RepID=UPI0025B967D3|nr:hypothetical protein [Acetobacter sp.]MCH4092182.1 hypothetical protein [Acetobacter sp.]MCI1299901.1 hypothetical protein [Acetobacter sp.]MCI1315919.1 hypothetical protein [Acetobacter sp.]
MTGDPVLKNSSLPVLVSCLVLFFGVMLQPDVAKAQSRYNGRASSTASRIEGYRQSGTSRTLSRVGAVPAAPSDALEKSSTRSSRPERIGGPYRSVLTPRTAPTAPTLPHIAKAVEPQSYKSEHVPTSTAKR